MKAAASVQPFARESVDRRLVPIDQKSAERAGSVDQPVATTETSQQAVRAALRPEVAVLLVALVLALMALVVIFAVTPAAEQTLRVECTAYSEPGVPCR
jgi:hypothetical protein